MVRRDVVGRVGAPSASHRATVCNLRIAILASIQALLLIAYLNVSACSAVQTAAWSSPRIAGHNGRTVGGVSPTSSSFDRHRMYSIRGRHQQQHCSPTNLSIHQSSMIDLRCSGSASGSRLFPQRELCSRSYNMPTRLMLSSSNDSSNNEVDERQRSPLVKVWLSFRKFLAKFWVSTCIEIFFLLIENLLTSRCTNLCSLTFSSL